LTKSLNEVEAITTFLRDEIEVEEVDGIARVRLSRTSPGIEANAYYFGHPKWADSWLRHVHRYPELRDRWLAAAGSWDDRVVVDIGCGPGNLFACVGTRPDVLIGVDVAEGSLRIAKTQGYLPLLADAQDLPFRNAFADLVVLNGSLHHIDDMTAALREGARLVKPGGYLVTDHDPQRSAWNFRGFGKLLWELRRPIYRALERGGHSAVGDEGTWALRTELHHKPGDGVSREWFLETLEPLGFEVRTYPHSHRVGAAALDGEMGRPPMQIRIGQLLSGIGSSTPAGALSLMCVARRT
ncbi:methyltransferase, partial [Mycobacterium numidiamassiliense]